jgi:GAF domain-containing protein
MSETVINDREMRRLAALYSYDVLDTPTEQAFDEVAALAAQICETSIAVVNLIGDGRQFFKAEVGLGVRETPLEWSFCAKAILEEDFLLVPDATKDPRFEDNPLVTGDTGLRFYAGALLKTQEGLPIGTLCVLDARPRDLTPLQQKTLRVLANQVMMQLDLRRSLKQREASETRLRASQNGSDARILHDIRRCRGGHASASRHRDGGHSRRPACRLKCAVPCARRSAGRRRVSDQAIERWRTALDRSPGRICS